MNEMLLDIRNLAKIYDTGPGTVDVLRDVTFQVARGEMLALTGASGVGKSTLLHLLGGLDRETGGSIRYRGRLLNAMSESERERYRNREIGFVFQFHHLLPEFTAAENVAVPLLIRGEQHQIAHDQAMAMLDRVGLGFRALHKPGELSGGEQQRVALARAVVTQPSIVLADEPTGNLDEDTSRDVFNLIVQLNRELGVTFVVATHNLNLARSTHRWLRLTDGRLESMDGTRITNTP
ncbi:ABC transporter ATP-binding protein [bacterium]|nr:ABC transporter ATP-binding protein [candidate division CSSED10-310 bacterium]